MSSARETLLAAVGVAGILLAVAVAAGVAPAAVLGPVAGLDPTLATGLLGVALVGYALRRRRQTPAVAEPALTAALDGRDAEDPGVEVDDAIRRVEATAARRYSGGVRDEVRERVRATAVRAYARARSADDAAADEAVATGTWTEDPVAAAFVGDDRAPRYPLRERLRGWLHPGRAFRRRARRAADEAHALATEGSR